MAIIILLTVLDLLTSLFNTLVLQIAEIVQWFLEGEKDVLHSKPSHISLRVLRVKNRFELPSEQVVLSHSAV